MGRTAREGHVGTGGQERAVGGSEGRRGHLRAACMPGLLTAAAHVLLGKASNMRWTDSR